VHVRQQVLAMDEESALNASTGGIDVRSIAAFDQWITSDPANLEQVLPEQRGVVAFMTPGPLDSVLVFTACLDGQFRRTAATAGTLAYYGWTGDGHLSSVPGDWAVSTPVR
jgi:hypothetical protein